MRLMAVVTDHASGVLDRSHLREGLGFRRILFVAAAAQVGDIGQLGNVRTRIVGV